MGATVGSRISFATHIAITTLVDSKEAIANVNLEAEQANAILKKYKNERRIKKNEKAPKQTTWN